MTNLWLRNALRAAAIIAAVAGVRFLFVLPYRASLVMPEVEERTVQAKAASSVAAAKLARANLEDLSVIEESRQLDPEWYLLYGANCEVLGRDEDAAAIYSRALRIDQRPEIYLYRGLVMLQLGRVDDAVRDLATAARFQPEIVNDVDGELRARVVAAAGNP